MKLHLNRVLVVEGKEDASYLSNYIDSEIVFVNGFELSQSTISYLKYKPVILLLDPDEAGINIREKLNKKLNNVVNIDVDINKCTRGLKNGVAECEIEEVLEKLSEFCGEKQTNQDEIKSSDLYKLNLSDNKELRKYVCDKLNLGNCNSKTLKNRLNLNGITLEMLCEIIKEYKNGNQ